MVLEECWWWCLRSVVGPSCSSREGSRLGCCKARSFVHAGTQPPHACTHEAQTSLCSGLVTPPAACSALNSGLHGTSPPRIDAPLGNTSPPTHPPPRPPRPPPPKHPVHPPTHLLLLGFDLRVPRLQARAQLAHLLLHALLLARLPLRLHPLLRHLLGKGGWRVSTDRRWHG